MKLVDVKNEASPGSVIKSEHIDTLVSKSLCDSIITVGQSGMFQDLISANDSATAGQTIFVSSGTYNLGNEGIQLKDGVNWQFMLGVTVNSDFDGGTFYDNNIGITTMWSGEPTIVNSNGLDKRIILQNVESLLTGFWWEYIGLVWYNSSLIHSRIIKNTLGGSVVWSRTSTGNYPLTLSKAFTNKIIMSADYDNNQISTDGTAMKFISMRYSNTDSVALICQRSVNTGPPTSLDITGTNENSPIRIQIRVYP